MSVVSKPQHQGTKNVRVRQSIGQAFVATLKRDLVIAYRSRSDIVNPMMFFLIVVTLFPLGVSPEPDFLAQIAPGVLWVSALLATLLSMDGMFRSDYQDGSLEQLLLSPQPLFVMVLAKISAHWFASSLPLILLSPVLGVMMFLPSDGIVSLILTLLVGTPVLSLLGAIGAALTLGVGKGGLLLSLLILPLYTPILIFATLAVQASVAGLATTGQMAILGALLALALITAPFATAAALRITIDG